MIRNLVIILVVSVIPILAGTWGDYITLQTPCDPNAQNGGILTTKNAGKVCFSGSYCNPKTKICDCTDSDDGKWRRTFQDGECKLLPGSTCVNVDQDYYRCVKNAKCTVVREGADILANCPADAPCDLGDFQCKCQKGKTCLEHKVEAPKL